MDTLTHFAVGACLGELTGKKNLGKKALAIGGIAQLIPDIDFLFGLWMSPAGNALAHRGLTHSFLFLAIITCVIAAVNRRWWSGGEIPFMFWIKFIGLEILIHLFLDSLNAYGTGWFEPFSHVRVSFNTIFVADPFFSIPAGVGALILFLAKPSLPWRRMTSMVCLFLCGLYICYTVYNKLKVTEAVLASFRHQHIDDRHYFTTPTPFNNWLWYVVSSNGKGSYVGYRSVFDKGDHVAFEFFPRNDSLLVPFKDEEDVERLLRFSKGHYTVAQRSDTIIFNDLRFGQMVGWENPRAGFVFHYYLSPPLDNTLVIQRGRFVSWDRNSVGIFLKRIAGK